MGMYYIKMTILHEVTLENEPVSPTGQFKKFLTISVTDSPLSVTNIAS